METDGPHSSFVNIELIYYQEPLGDLQIKTFISAMHLSITIVKNHTFKIGLSNWWSTGSGSTAVLLEML